MGILSTLIGGAASLFGQNKEAKLQKQFAQKGIQWKVADAEAAGIHPLFALGANTVSYQPQGLGSTLGDIGQNVGRAAEAAMDPGERATSFGKAAERLQLTRMGLENEKLASEIRLLRQPGSPPSAPGGAVPIIPGQGNARIPLDPDAKAMRLRLPAGGGDTVDFPTSGTSNSQTIADQYGDTAQEVYGMWRLANDVYSHYVKPSDDYYTSLFWKKLAAAQAMIPPMPSRRRVGGGRYGRR